MRGWLGMGKGMTMSGIVPVVGEREWRREGCVVHERGGRAVGGEVHRLQEGEGGGMSGDLSLRSCLRLAGGDGEEGAVE